jgi:hypothetical protein
MSARNVALGWLVVFGVAMVAPGCNRNADTLKPPPVEVVIAQPVSEKIVDWDA